MKVQPNYNKMVVNSCGSYIIYIYIYIIYILYSLVEFNSSLSWLFGCPLLLN